MEIVYLPKFEGSTSNPARCLIPQERIEVNGLVWPFLTEPEKDFVMQHELGHCNLKTYDECKADTYALQQLALKKPYSLQNYVKSVKAISHNDRSRVCNAQYQALKVSAKEGNKYAQELLNKYYANADGANAKPDKKRVKGYWIIILIIIVLGIWVLKK